MSASKQPFSLTRDERMSPLWHKLHAHMAGQIEVLRMMNDADRNEVETARLRGRIAAYKELMALNNEIDPASQPVAVATDF